MLGQKNLNFTEKTYYKRLLVTLIEERTIALAGILQAAAQVQSLARTGEPDPGIMESMLQSILILDAVSTPAVYGGLSGLRPGLTMIAEGFLNSAAGEAVEILRYTMALLHLQNQLYRDDRLFNEFGQAVERLSAHSGDELVGACSDVYQQFVSNMRPQIIVQGEQNFLQRQDIPPKVRAMLLAGIRAAVLWQQKEGGRFKMIWERTRMQNAARRLLAQSGTDA